LRRRPKKPYFFAYLRTLKMVFTGDFWWVLQYHLKKN